MIPRPSHTVVNLPPQPPPGVLNLPGVMMVGGVVMGLRPERRTESLGTKQMEGLTVEGVRVIVTLPVGWEGYDRSFQIAVENWLSTDLGVVVLWTTYDPRVGQSTWKLTHITTNEPDRTLFRVPTGYTSDDVH